MTVRVINCGAIVAAMLPAAALADDPRDAAMRSAAARARDAATTRRLNLAENDMVRRRDTGRWQVVRAPREDVAGGDADDAGGARNYERAMADYDRRRAQYERDMAAWHRAVAACEAGVYDACDSESQ